jgi:SAM-dependent methyltransferase
VEAVAPDGSPVELYALLPPAGEAELVVAAAAPGAEVLELGCGAGRVTHELVARGFRVVAVDNSREMLARVHGAETVLGDIETLELGRRFDCVLLASNLVNDAHRSDAFLAACRRHVQPDGVVVIERLDPEWQAHEGTSVRDGVEMTLRDLERDGAVVSGAIDYRAGERMWTHTWTMRILDDDALEAVLAAAGLVKRRFLDGRRSWVEAVPAPRG